MAAPAHMSSKFITHFPLETKWRSRQSPAVHFLPRHTCATRAYETWPVRRCVSDGKPTTPSPSKLRPIASLTTKFNWYDKLEKAPAGSVRREQPLPAQTTTL